jgi:hypothetical protein
MEEEWFQAKLFIGILLDSDDYDLDRRTKAAMKILGAAETELKIYDFMAQVHGKMHDLFLDEKMDLIRAGIGFMFDAPTMEDIVTSCAKVKAFLEEFEDGQLIKGEVQIIPCIVDENSLFLEYVNDLSDSDSEDSCPELSSCDEDH